MNDKLLNKQDLADLLGVHVQTINNLRYRGDGPPEIKLGRQIRFRRADVDAWIESHRVTRPGH